jgi:cob(I)alamin adenosyltransferase
MKRKRVHLGDGGQTGLPGGRRVSKGDARIAALGEVDELCALLGVSRTELESAGEGESATVLARVQRDLFALAGRLALLHPPSGADQPKLAWGPERLEGVERAIAERETRLPQLSTFILPGGVPASVWLDLGRAVCRRAERAIVVLAEREEVEGELIAYLNRLSALLFVLARDANARAGKHEEPW